MDAQYGAGAQLQSCWTYKEHFVDGITFPFLHYRNDSISLHLCYFSKYACVKPQNDLHNILPDPTSRSGYNFRKSSYPVPTVSRTSTLTFFLPRAIILWNGLPADLQLLTTSNSFKSALKKYLKLTWLYLLFLWNTFLVLSYPYDTSFCLVHTPPPPPPPTGT